MSIQPVFLPHSQLGSNILAGLWTGANLRQEAKISHFHNIHLSS